MRVLWYLVGYISEAWRKFGRKLWKKGWRGSNKAKKLRSNFMYSYMASETTFLDLFDSLVGGARTVCLLIIWFVHHKPRLYIVQPFSLQLGNKRS